ncbi:MAG: hydrogenase 4 subunit F [Peptococcaceae bacterium]|nr:hydrogenase 4 subunit F [Peptococcaceae bacterium]
MIYLLLAAPLITALICLFPMKLRKWEIISSLGAILTGIVAIACIQDYFSKEKPIEHYGLFLDGLSTVLVFVIAMLGMICCLYSIRYIRKEIERQEFEEKRVGKFYSLIHIFIATMYLTVLADNLGVMWVAIEATTIVSALLVGFSGHKEALEAAWKYIIICTVGIAFAMLGIILTYYAAQATAGEEQFALSWHSLYPVAHHLNPSLMKLAFIFILVGFGTKAGVFPLHTWLPDAHSQAPSPVSALLSGVLLNCAIYAIIRFHLLTMEVTGSNFSSGLMILFGIISMIGAFPFILVQKDIKRLLAYSSVEHVGIIILGIGLGGTLGYTGALLHLINHALGKGTLFLCAGTIVQEYRTKFIQKMQGIGQLLPVTGTVFLASLFAIGGAPPFGLFVSEMSVAGRGFQVYGFGLGFIFLMSVAIVFTGLVYFGGKMYFSDLPSRFKVKEPLTINHVLLILPLILLVFQGIYIPESIQNIFFKVVESMIAGGGNHV